MFDDLQIQHLNCPWSKNAPHIVFDFHQECRGGDGDIWILLLKEWPGSVGKWHLLVKVCHSKILCIKMVMIVFKKSVSVYNSLDRFILI